MVAIGSDGVSLLTDADALAGGVLVAFADRRGGVSRAPFDELNLAASVGDERAHVMENRRRAAAAASFEVERLALARQVHGVEVIEVVPGTAGVVGEADGLVTRAPGSVLGILTADCAPVLVAGRNGVGVLHAGWRGLVAGVVERGLEALGEVDSAWIGPCIRACCYEVGPEVTEAFARRDLPVADERHVDVMEAARTALVHGGVPRVVVAEACTHHDGRYFSYRRDSLTGRQGSFIALVEDR